MKGSILHGVKAQNPDGRSHGAPATNSKQRAFWLLTARRRLTSLFFFRDQAYALEARFANRIDY